MEFKNLVKKRASIRKFSSKKPSTEEIIELIRTANLAPSPGNLPILRYIVIEEPETISKIADACQQDFVSQAPIIVIVCSDPKNADRAYGKRAARYIKHHAGAAIENFLLKAVDIGLASCWVDAFSDETIKNLLKIHDDSIEVEAVLPVGYPLVTDKTKQRNKPTLEIRVFFETWKNRFRGGRIKLPRISDA